jgi:hypothetical protein
MNTAYITVQTCFQLRLFGAEENQCRLRKLLVWFIGMPCLYSKPSLSSDLELLVLFGSAFQSTKQCVEIS